MSKFLCGFTICILTVFSLPLGGDCDTAGALAVNGLGIQVRTANALERAFSESHSKFAGADVAVWGRLSGEFLPEGRLRSIAADLVRDMSGRAPDDVKADRVGLEGRIDYAEQYRRVRTAKVTGKLSKDIRLYMTVQSVKGDSATGNEGSETYILVKVWSQGGGARHDRRSAGLTRIAVPPVTQLCRRYSVTHSIWGAYGGILSEKEKNGVVGRIAGILGCGKMIGGSAADHVNVSGFSPKLANQVKVGRQSINVNIALRDDLAYGVTRFFIASPIIIDEY